MPPLPTTSLLAATSSSFSYCDSVRQPVPQTVNSEALLHAFFQATPSWIERLMRWRDRLVAPFGLKTAGPATRLPSHFQVGQRLGIFRVLQLTAHEAVLGEDDRHLDFRISLLWQDGELAVSTLVRPHNRAGRLYLACVLPWHHLISATVTRRMAARLSAPRPTEEST